MWLKATSANFEVYTTSGEKRAREAIRYFEQVNSFFQKAVHAARSAKGRVRIIAFQSQAEYRPYRLTETSPAYSGGDASRDEIVLGSISVVVAVVVVMTVFMAMTMIMKMIVIMSVSRLTVHLGRSASAHCAH